MEPLYMPTPEVCDDCWKFLLEAEVLGRRITSAEKELKKNPIVNITRSGLTFTATRLDGSTFTFTQRDNDTKYIAGKNISISSDNVISAAGAEYTAGSNVTISPANVISSYDTRAWQMINQILSSLGGNELNLPVIKTYKYTIKQENFVKVSFDGVTPVCWFSGAGGDWEGDVFSIPVETMDTILGVYCQVRTVGNKTNPETVAIQAWRREGDRLIIDIDGYEVIFNGYDPYDLPVDILVVGTKKISI